MRRQGDRAASEQGAILVHVAFGILAVMAFTTFVIDAGVFYESRRQAQNAADAGALAGAISLAYDDPTDFSVTGPGKQAAVQIAQSNLIWGSAPSVNPATDVQIFSGTGVCPPPNTDGTCIRVDVHRTQARGNPLPMFFGALVGLTQQDVIATATAMVAAANTANCIKPVAVADKWIESTGAWTPTSTFDPASGDVYIPPTSTNPGSGFTIANDYGTILLLKPGRPNDAINPGWFQPIRLPGSSGGNDYRTDWATCRGGAFSIGDYLEKENGNMIGPTAQGVGDLIDLDPYATWNSTTKQIENSCWETNSCVGNPGARQSPRVVALPVFDLQEYMDTGGTGNGTVRIVNILGFFVLDMVGNDLSAVLINAPGLFNAGGGTVTGSASFLNTVMLVR
jgi:hypothetical protein